MPSLACRAHPAFHTYLPACLSACHTQVLLVNSPNLPNIPSIAETSRGKRSCHVDLDTQAGRDSLTELLRGADVVIEAYRPGALVRRRDPRTVVVRLRTSGLTPALFARARAASRRSAWPSSARAPSTCGSPPTGARGRGQAGAVLTRWSRLRLDSTTPRDTAWRPRVCVLLTRSPVCTARAHALADVLDGLLSVQTADPAPRALPFQALDCASGWLMAFVAEAALLRQVAVGAKPTPWPRRWLTCAGGVRACARQMDEGGSWLAELSLAQTAHWLRSLPRVPRAAAPVPPGALAAATERMLEESDSGFGRLRALRHAARMSHTPPRRQPPSMPTGSHPPAWQPRQDGDSAQSARM
jgi:hypothetical protein